MKHSNRMPSLPANQPLSSSSVSNSYECQSHCGDTCRGYIYDMTNGPSCSLIFFDANWTSLVVRNGTDSFQKMNCTPGMGE